MLTLAIDTSGLSGSVALLDADNCLAERDLELGRNHGQALVPEIGRLFSEQGRAIAECRLIAVSVGPGSFTGLRVGVVCAKTLAYAVGCPAVGVDTFLAIAEHAPTECSEIQIVEDAQRGDLFVGRYRQGAGGAWEPAAAIGIVPAEEWLAALKRHDVVAGPGLARVAGRLADCCRPLDPAAWRPRAAVVGRLGQRLRHAGAAGDPYALEPRYIRRSSAEEKWEARSALPDLR